MYTKYPMSDKIKVAIYLDKELDDFLEKNRGEELKKTQYIRIILRQEMRRKGKKVKPKELTNGSDPFASSIISPNMIPGDLKDCVDLIVEWWPIRKQKGAINSKKVANRLFDKLRSFPSQDRKKALENAITAGWKDIYEVKKGYKPEEPKNNHPAARVFTAKRGFE